jgi:hypothetical protein
MSSIRGADTCLFCLEGTEYNKLIHNSKCSCKYTYHVACFNLYDRKAICPLCKRNVASPVPSAPAAPSAPAPARVAPSAPAPSAPVEQIVITVHTPLTRNVIIRPTQPSTKRLITAIAALITLLVIIYFIRWAAVLNAAK